MERGIRIAVFSPSLLALEWRGGRGVRPGQDSLGALPSPTPTRKTPIVNVLKLPIFVFLSYNQNIKL
jgi:hypothetical protein